MNNYILKACRNCGGDLAKDCDDWICLQCGRYSYVGLYSQPEPPVDSRLPLPRNPRPLSPGADSRRPGPGGGGNREQSGDGKAAVLSPTERPTLAGILP